MALKPNIVVALDIGTSSIKVVLGEIQQDGRVDIIGIGTVPSKGLRKGVVINIEATVESISAAIHNAQMMAGCQIDSVFAAISGSHIKSFNSHGIVGIKNKEVSQYDIEKVIEAAKAVAIPLERELLHVLPQEFIIDEQDGIREPLGISGVRLEAKVHLVTGSVASGQNIVKCANRCGLSVQDIIVAPLAAGRAVVSAEEKELGVCLIDIGGGTAGVAVYHGGALRYTTVLSVGGTHITNDIAAGLRTPLMAAEDIKRKFGTALVSLVSKEETIEVPSTGGRTPRVLSKLVLSEIIEPRVAEIFNLIHKDLVRANCDEMLTSGVVLCGGTAGLKGICQLAEQIFNLPVRVGLPLGVGGLTEIVNYPEYAAGVGLVLSGAEGSKKSKLLAGRSIFTRTFKRVGNWFGENF